MYGKRVHMDPTQSSQNYWYRPNDGIQKYNIKPIKTQIEDQCKTIIEKIIGNNDHPITKRLLTKNTSSISTRIKYNIILSRNAIIYN